MITCLIGSLLSSYIMFRCAEGLFIGLSSNPMIRLPLLHHIRLSLSFGHCYSTSFVCLQLNDYKHFTIHQSHFDQSRAGVVNKLWQTDKKCSVKVRKRWKELQVSYGRLPKLQLFYYLDYKVSSVFTCLPHSSCTCLFEQDLVGWEWALCQGSWGGRH